MKLTFKPNLDRVVVTENFVSNGHWAIKKDLILIKKELKKLIPYTKTESGHYIKGCAPLRTITEAHERTILSISDYHEKTHFTGYTLIRSGTLGITSIGFVAHGQHFLINPEYAFILTLGEIYVDPRNNKSPIFVKSDDKIVAVLMPMVG